MIHILVNGERRQIPPQQTVRELVVQLGFKDKPVAVEVNKQLVPRRLHERHQLSEGDVVEVVTFVGGG